MEATEPVETVEQTDLERFQDRVNKELARQAIAIQWHMDLHAAHGIKFPWQVDTTSVWCNQEKKNDDGEYELDEEGTQLYIKKVVNLARSKGYGVRYEYTEKHHKTFITLDDELNVKMCYTINREVVCEEKPTGKMIFKPAEMIEETEWVCQKVAFTDFDPEA